ncbi:FixH family protein [Oceanospirillum beijerinckii]|uniref:FixH family protein n=1 Tax=Oceanospirillum beijerinckii TaxID=64976 RepID=UPI0003FD23D1|nr:FixH family protein [Oceanospirillum beijerinckii]
MQNTNSNSTVWYKQFWPWFLLVPLIVTVIVGITMLTLSIKFFDGTVNDNYYKEGLAINQVLQRDRTAAELNMAADMKVDELTGEVVLTLAGQLQSWPEQLRLQMINPTRATLDYEIALSQISNNHYRGQLEKIPQNFWYMDVSPVADNTWRLKGGSKFPATEAIIFKAGAQQ